jgi:L-asparaginase
MSRVAVVFTGGTISTTYDPVAGGHVPTLDAAALIGRTPGLDQIAQLDPIDLGRTPASHFTFADLARIAGVVREALDNPTVVGAVVVQGTDTIEESAFFWDLVLDGPKPVVVTGAMRSASDPDSDGSRNLRDAVRSAADLALREVGVIVVLGGRIEPADTVVKSHATAFDTFRSLEHEPLGRVDDRGVIVERPRGARRRLPGGVAQRAAERAPERIHVITATTGIDGTLLDAALAAGADGFVIAATGSGNATPTLLAAAVRAIAAGVPVVLTTRCPAGAVEPAYAFPGGGRQWLDAGAIMAGHLSAPKARVALALGLGAGLDRNGLAALLADPGVPPAR